MDTQTDSQQGGDHSVKQIKTSSKITAVFLLKFENANHESSVALAEGLKLTGNILGQNLSDVISMI